MWTWRRVSVSFVSSAGRPGSTAVNRHSHPRLHRRSRRPWGREPPLFFIAVPSIGRKTKIIFWTTLNNWQCDINCHPLAKTVPTLHYCHLAAKLSTLFYLPSTDDDIIYWRKRPIVFPMPSIGQMIDTVQTAIYWRERHLLGKTGRTLYAAIYWRCCSNPFIFDSSHGLTCPNQQHQSNLQEFESHSSHQQEEGGEKNGHLSVRNVPETTEEEEEERHTDKKREKEREKKMDNMVDIFIVDNDTRNGSEMAPKWVRNATGMTHWRWPHILYTNMKRGKKILSPDVNFRLFLVLYTESSHIKHNWIWTLLKKIRASWIYDPNLIQAIITAWFDVN